MPAPIGNEWFITLTHPLGMDEKRIGLFRSWVISNCEKYFCVSEKHQSGLLHLHGAFHTRKSHRGDTLKKSILHAVDPALCHDPNYSRRGCVVKKMFHEQQLIGSYLLKADNYEIVMRTDTYTDEMLDKCYEDYKHLQEVGKSETERPVLTRHNVVSVIQKMSEDCCVPIVDEKSFVTVLHHLMDNGITLVPVKNELKFVYKMIRAQSTGDTSWLVDEIFGYGISK